MMERAANLAKFLLEIDAVKLNPGQPFVWTSGIKSPIYCDNRATLFYPEVRAFLKKALSDLATENFKDFDVVAGIATAGIPAAANCSDMKRACAIETQNPSALTAWGSPVFRRSSSTTRLAHA